MGDEFLSHADAAQLNRNNVLHYVKNHSSISRTDIWRDMSISRASVTQIIRQLQEMDLILETGEKHPSGRRKSRELCFNNDARFEYVFDWHTQMLCLVNIGGDILEKLPLTFPQNCTPNVFAGIVSEGVEVLAKLHPVDESRMLGLGVILPGLIDSRDCTVLYSVELGWRNVNVRYLFADQFQENVFLERWSNMIALGEYVFGAARGYNHVMLVLLENEGIGLSAVVRGDCQHGNNYMYGELGHIKLPSRITCSCGQQGCLEAIVRDCMLRNGGIVDDEVMEYISFGVSTAINLSDPGIALLSGRLVRQLSPDAEKNLIGRIRRKVTNDRSRAIEIHICREEEMMGIRGMSAYIFDLCFAN